MRRDDAADVVRRAQAPWDDVRAARVQRRVLDAMRRPAAPRRPRGRVLARRVVVALAAVVAVALGAVGAWRATTPPPPTTSATAHLEFADGSTVAAGEGARVVAESVAPDAIQVRQTAGVASYDVTPRPERRFVVVVRDVRVEVLGTAFDVEAGDDHVTVAVRRGRVKVSRGDRDVVLGPGEELRLRDGEREVPPEVSAVASASSAPAEVSSAPGAAASVPRSDERSAAELFRAADDARAAGDVAEALRLLRLLVDRHPRDSRVTMAVFTIGRLERQRGNLAAAAAAFESCGGALRGEALAEAALAHAQAGSGERARVLARTYLQRFPDGPRARELERLAR